MKPKARTRSSDCPPQTSVGLAAVFEELKILGGAVREGTHSCNYFCCSSEMEWRSWRDGIKQDLLSHSRPRARHCSMPVAALSVFDDSARTLALIRPLEGLMKFFNGLIKTFHKPSKAPAYCWGSTRDGRSRLDNAGIGQRLERLG